jgi:hypothetical protein
MPVSYRDIKVPEPIYQNTQILRQKALELGFGQIRDEIGTTSQCPLCQSPMEQFRAEYQYNTCPKCGFSQQQIAAAGSGALGLGVIIGLGLAALAQLLSDSDQAPRRRSSRRR